MSFEWEFPYIFPPPYLGQGSSCEGKTKAAINDMRIPPRRLQISPGKWLCAEWGEPKQFHHGVVAMFRAIPETHCELRGLFCVLPATGWAFVGTYKNLHGFWRIYCDYSYSCETIPYHKVASLVGSLVEVNIISPNPFTFDWTK